MYEIAIFLVYMALPELDLGLMRCDLFWWKKWNAISVSITFFVLGPKNMQE